MRTKTFRLQIIIVLLVFTCQLNAQILFISDSKEDMKNLSDSLVLYSKRDYTYKKEHIYNQYTYSLTYENSQDKEDTIEIFFNVRYINQNIELEIEGIPEYNFSHVKAKFLDLLPFWIRYIKQDEDQEQILSKKASFIFKSDKRFLFSKQGDLWIISMKDKL